MGSTAGERVPRRAHRVFDCELCLGGARGRLLVRGCVDDSTAALLRDELEEARRTAISGLDVDLCQVDGLSSSGARLLHEAVVAASDRGAPVRLLAQPGTPVAQLLDLHAVPYEAARPDAG